MRATARVGVILLAIFLASISSLPYLRGQADVECQLLRSLNIDGEDSRETAKIRWKLLLSSEVRRSLAVEDSIEKQCKIISQILEASYQSEGFPKVKCDATYDADLNRLDVKIEKGPQRLLSDIQIGGLSKDRQELLKKWLTSSNKGEGEVWAPSLDGRWMGRHPSTFKPGDVASFPIEWIVRLGRTISPNAELKIRSAVHDFLVSIGYFGSIVDVRLEQNEDTLENKLVIDVLQLGTPVTVQEVRFHGLKLNDADSLSKFLELRTGDTWNHDQALRVQRILFDSARFRWHNVTFNHYIFDQSKVVVDITLVESPSLPTIDQPLTERQQQLIAKVTELTGGDMAFELSCLREGSDERWQVCRGALFKKKLLLEEFLMERFSELKAVGYPSLVMRGGTDLTKEHCFCLSGLIRSSEESEGYPPLFIAPVLIAEAANGEIVSLQEGDVGILDCGRIRVEWDIKTGNPLSAIVRDKSAERKERRVEFMLKKTDSDNTLQVREDQNQLVHSSLYESVQQILEAYAFFVQASESKGDHGIVYQELLLLKAAELVMDWYGSDSDPMRLMETIMTYRPESDIQVTARIESCFKDSRPKPLLALILGYACQGERQGMAYPLWSYAARNMTDKIIEDEIDDLFRRVPGLLQTHDGFVSLVGSVSDEQFRLLELDLAFPYSDQFSLLRTAWSGELENKRIDATVRLLASYSGHIRKQLDDYFEQLVAAKEKEKEKRWQAHLAKTKTDGKKKGTEDKSRTKDSMFDRTSIQDPLRFSSPQYDLIK
ncbi:MAG: hypothetical protein MUC43_12965 [Pirellula sp.]|jgi:hypothetical protein|nr:hypothetical protein [Pirellula sp.]